ncbi:GPR1/FUN34/YaaH family transporter [Effusibacillus consociatus]|uniref:GPR1/FUN34/YaaH family transporter n=1 Tax=Effusibacillus consociatus TaxID=1117041 RepID=A0ABV9Q417_9BACL
MNEKSQIADPAPLGLAAFALTTFVLSLSNAHLVPSSISHLFLTLGLFYVSLLGCKAIIPEYVRKLQTP